MFVINIIGHNWVEHPRKFAVKLRVKFAANLAVITILAILVIAEVIALADITNFPTVTYLNFGDPVSGHGSPPPEPLAPGLYEITNYPPFEIGSPVSDYDGSTSKLPAPGLYETHPYAMVLKVPNSTADACVLRNLSSEAMSIQHPQLEVIPKVAAVPQAKK